jgi:2-oxoglutarate ferredoxin oxidoreductase subunit alpha
LSGNEAICLGAIKAGCKFFAAYPMTPINSIISFFAAKAEELEMIYFQPEDEICGINAAIGASFAGVRSMVATSGGGFSLMVESYGLAGMTETPLVIIEGQRPGPSTGLPTWTSQGDLRFVLHASQDDFPRIVLAPGDQEECFWLTIEAFNLADKYQTPVVILTDKYLAESYKSVDYFDESNIKIDRGLIMSLQQQKKEYQRYKITDSGISPRPFVGREALTFIANSDEHNEFGFSDEDAEIRKKMMEKRMRKLITCQNEIPDPKIYGDLKSKILLISWGSSKGPVLEAQKILKENNISTKFLHLNFINPLPINFLNNFFASLNKEDKVLIIEQNIAGQLAGLIREKTGFFIDNHLLKYDGRPFFPEEIVKKVKEII